MNDLGGGIRVESTFGKRAEFTLYVPRGEIEEASPEAIAHQKHT